MRKCDVGGQAIIEGVMMRGPQKTAMAVRKPDKEIECKVEDNKVFTLDENVYSSSFDCDLYFRDDCIKSSAVVIIAFYDNDNRLVQMASETVYINRNKVEFSIDFESKPYSKYKIMVWESLGNIKPLMAEK